VQYKLLHEESGERTFAVVLSTGEEVFSSLNDFITRENVHAAHLTGIGALSGLVLMYFDWEKKEYLKRPVKEQVEVASLIGDVAEDPAGAHAAHTYRGRHARRQREGRASRRSARPAHAGSDRDRESHTSAQGERPREWPCAHQTGCLIKSMKRLR
jgi:uncharacterized protein